ncbi:MAG: PTS system mannose/fructose/sorbose family transporter subunit IID, partial [Enterococcus hulanensis]
LAQQGSILGPILAMIISFVPSFLVTYYGGKFGYSMGNKYLTKLYEGGLMDRVMYVCSIIGLMVIGAMIASMIGITTPIKFGKTFILQDVLDNIMPQMLPFALTMFMYWLLQKKVNTSIMLLICIVGGLILSALGIFV